MTLPAPAMAYAANSELVLHGWDLAVATDQRFEVAADNLEAAWQLVSNTPDDPAARAGLFGPAPPAVAGGLRFLHSPRPELVEGPLMIIRDQGPCFPGTARG